MRWEFERCQKLLFEAVTRGLQEAADYIRSIERTGRGDSPVTGLSLDMFPWFSNLTLSLRVFDDCAGDRASYRYNAADWKHFDFPRAWETRTFAEAGKLINDFYLADGSYSRERAHLIFLAGAEALLDPRVANQLKLLGIDAPTVSDDFLPHFFEYMVVDSDATIAANYCEIVAANRVTARLLGKTDDK
jgi:hypothetical protein